MDKKCIEEELLAGYVDGLLSEKEMAKVERHLSDCDTCLQAVIINNTMVKRADLPELRNVPDKVTKKAIQLIRTNEKPQLEALKNNIKQSTKGLFTIVSDMVTSFSGPQPNLAAVRGRRKSGPNNKAVIVKSFNGIKAIIEIEKTARGKAHISVGFPESGSQSNGVRVTLKKNDREVSSFLVENTKPDVFEDVPLDHYSLVFLKAGEMLGIYFFQMKE